ncbi:Ca2+ regulator and membrane fusion protein Fig1-domain-containing protein [Lipomyces arxii]|uniref:Ca2+ regulator and membrane fusion protein Fig1-domain-containing protein n=1 Tax=Lipomyces arxii TaxID=56418 RepID=UPI0034CE0DE9
MIFWLIKLILPKKVNGTKSIRSFVSTLLFITIFLLLFSLLGSLSTKSTYSSVYAVQFKSALASNKTLTLQSGYYGVCADMSSIMTCSHRGNTSSLDPYRAVRTKSNGVVDLVSLAELVSTKLIHPTLPIAGLLFVCIAFFSSIARSFVTSVESMSASVLNSVTLWSCILSTVVWGMAVAWTHVSSNTLALVLHDSTGGLISAVRGTKLDAMGWTAFGFLLLSTASIVLCVALDARSHTPPPPRDDPTDFEYGHHKETIYTQRYAESK